jgi:hypothetical protein
MSTSAIQSTSALQQIAQSLIKTFDKNSDGVLSADEFTSFLGNLLNAASPTTSSVVTQPLTVAQTLTQTSSSTPTYQPMAGWDTTKLNNLNHQTPKYIFGRWVQGKAATTDSLKQFVAEHPEWEMDGKDRLRVKPDEMAKLYPGETSLWMDVIYDVGGPEARWQYIEAAS